MNEHRQIIGKRIAELRAEKKLSLQELSDKSGVTKANISRIENGKYNVGIDVLTKLAEAINCTIVVQKNTKNH